MRKTGLGWCVLVCGLILAQTTFAQGFKDILGKLESVETRLQNLDGGNKQELDELNKRLASVETAIGNIPETSDSGESITEINSRLDSIETDLAQVVSEVFQLLQNNEQSNSATGNDMYSELSESIQILRSELAAVTGTTAVMVETLPEAEETAATYSCSASFDPAIMSRYVWRGILLNDEPVLQPSLSFGCNNITLNIWGSMDLTDSNGYKNEMNELDFTLDYSSNVSIIGYSTGIIRYTFPYTDFDSTTELYLALSSEKTGNLSATVFQDVATAEGTYISFGNGTSIPVGSITSIDISGALNWGSARHNNFYYGNDASAITDCLLSFSATFGLGGYVSVTPSVTFASLVNHSIRESFKAGDIDRDNIIGGIAVSAGF